MPRDCETRGRLGRCGHVVADERRASGIVSGASHGGAAFRWAPPALARRAAPRGTQLARPTGHVACDETCRRTFCGAVASSRLESSGAVAERSGLESPRRPTVARQAWLPRCRSRCRRSGSARRREPAGTDVPGEALAHAHPKDPDGDLEVRPRIAPPERHVGVRLVVDQLVADSVEVRRPHLRERVVALAVEERRTLRGPAGRDAQVAHPPDELLAVRSPKGTRTRR